MSWTLSRSLGIIAGSMTWRVQLAGDPSALRELAKVMQTPEATIHEEGSAFVLESTHFTGCKDPGEVQARGARLAEWLSGTAALALGTRTPITAGAIEGPPAPNGGRSIYVTATVAVHVRGTAWATVTRNRPDGTVETIHPADAVRAWLSLAQRRPEVADVLRQWGTGARDWYTLYQLREKIEAAAGGDGQIAARGWASRAKLRRFDHTANSQAILGDAARHGVQRTTPPANPMTLGEAQQLIERLIRGWVEELRASGS